VGSSSYQRIYAVVRRIPEGRVATYGQVASLAGLAGHARQVGAGPWHRVVNAKGGISLRSMPGGELVQRGLLKREGIPLDPRGRVPLARVRWQPRLKSIP